MMVGGSFLVSMADSSAADAQKIEAADSGDSLSDSDAQAASQEEINSDATGGEENTGGGENVESEPTVNENEDNNVIEEDMSGGEKTEIQGSPDDSAEPSQKDGGDNVVANGIASAPVNEQNTVNTGSDQADVTTDSHTNAPEDQQNPGTEPDAPKEDVVSEEAPEINQTPEKETQNEDGTVTITYKEGLGHPMDTENPKTYHKAPTCDEDGYNIVDVYCLYHEDLIIQRTIEIIPAIGHEMGEWKVVKEATLLENGSVERHCLREGCSHTETDTLIMVVVEPDPFQEEAPIVSDEPVFSIRPAVLGAFSPPPQRSSSGIYTSSVSPGLAVAIAGDETIDRDIIESPIPDITAPGTTDSGADFGSEDFSEVTGLSSYLVLAIDILLSLSLVVGLGVLWKLGIMRIR